MGMGMGMKYEHDKADSLEVWGTADDLGTVYWKI